MIDYDVIDAFAKKRKRQITVAILVIPFMLLRVFKSELRQLDFINDSIIGYALIAFILGILVFSFINWRCPKCEAYLGKEVLIKHCKKCGVQLVEKVE